MTLGEREQLESVGWRSLGLLVESSDLVQREAVRELRGLLQREVGEVEVGEDVCWVGN